MNKEKFFDYYDDEMIRIAKFWYFNFYAKMSIFLLEKE